MAKGGIAAAAAASADAVAEVAKLRRRNAELESENEQLRQLRGRNAELESEIERLRRWIQHHEGNHEVLPVIATVTVDLSRVDMGLVTHISSFIGRNIKRAAKPGTHVQIFWVASAHIS